MSDLKTGDHLKLVSAPNDAYEVLHVTNPNRAVIKFDGGIVICVDKGPEGWDLSGVPADADEQAVIEKYMPAKDTTQVDVVKDS